MTFYTILSSFVLENDIGLVIVKPIQDRRAGGGGEAPPTSYSPITSGTSISMQVSPKNFLTFSFNSFDKLVSNFKAIPSASRKLLN